MFKTIKRWDVIVCNKLAMPCIASLLCTITYPCLAEYWAYSMHNHIFSTASTCTYHFHSLWQFRRISTLVKRQLCNDSFQHWCCHESTTAIKCWRHPIIFDGIIIALSLRLGASSDWSWSPRWYHLKDDGTTLATNRVQNQNSKCLIMHVVVSRKCPCNICKVNTLISQTINIKYHKVTLT